MPPAASAALILSGLILVSVFCIRHAQRWVVVSCANFLEYAQPEREREGNGRTIVLSLPLSAAFLAYVIGAWGALTARVPNHFGSPWSSDHTWLYWGAAFILNLLVPIVATRLTMGFNDAEEANSFIRLETNAHHEKADTALVFALMSSWAILLASVVTLVTFAIAPSAAAFLFGWTVHVL